MKIKSYLQLAGFLMLSLLFLISCTPSTETAYTNNLDPQDESNVTEEMISPSEVDMISVDNEGSTAIDIEKFNTSLAEIPSGELSQVEIEGLIFMREEEKLAHDVYLELHKIWGLPIFQNIARSEQTHTEAVLSLITRYGLVDPVADTLIGEFANPALQSLYDQLVMQGSQSLIEALSVGATIEEIDILDLEEHLAETSNEAIVSVYQNLLNGS